MKRLNLTDYQYKMIINNMQFDMITQERKLFDMCCLGYTIELMANELNVSKRTISYRKNKLMNKIRFYLKENESLKETYCVYIHKFPNNKVYIGMTSNIKQRWNNGLGYQQNSKMFNDILKYGWNNIEHIIIADNLMYNQAIKLENEKIKEYNSFDNNYGYNVEVLNEK